MNHQTELMRSILKNQKAQKIIDYVSPIYEAIGTVLGEVCDISDELRYETNPAAAKLLLDMWEDHYGLKRDSRLTSEQRQLRLVAKTQSRGPCNPTRLAAAVSAALGGVPVDIQERTGKNTFLVNIREVVPSIVPAVAVLERMKPAHLIYQIRVCTQTISDVDIRVAVAITQSEQYSVEVYQ